jgi:hypothetical protein
MTDGFSKDRFAKAAKRLRTALHDREIEIGLARAQEAMARTLGFNDLHHWQTAGARTDIPSDKSLSDVDLKSRVERQASRLGEYLGLDPRLARELILEVRPTGDVSGRRIRFVANETEIRDIKLLVPSGHRKMFPSGTRGAGPGRADPRLTNLERVAVLLADYMNEVSDDSHQRWAYSCLDPYGGSDDLSSVAGATAAVFASVRHMDPIAIDWVYDCIRATWLSMRSQDVGATGWRDGPTDLIGRRIWECAIESVRRWNPAINPFDVAVKDWTPRRTRYPSR